MKATFACLAVLLLFSFALSAQPLPTALDRTLLHCENLIADGRVEEALRILTNVEEREKPDPRVVFLMAQCEYNLWRRDRKAKEHLDRARELLKETFRRKTPYPEAAFFAGLLETDLGHHGEAVRAFRAALAGGYRPSMSRKNLALALFEYGLDLAKKAKDRVDLADEAILVFKEARDRCEEIKDDMRNLPADRARFRELWLKSYSNLAAMHQEANNYPAAEKVLRELIRIQPANPFHYYHLGLLFGRKREWKEATRWYSKALEIDPGFVEPHLKLAYICSKEGRREEAERHFRTFLKHFPKSWEGHYELGEHHVRLKEYEKAIAEFRICLEVDPKAYVAMGKLADALRRSGKPDEAKPWQEKFEKLEAEANRKTAPPQPKKE